MQEPPYVGNGAYCYANSLQMCLKARAPPDRGVPDPGFLECLTSMPFGTALFEHADGPRLFFSPATLTPDAGLDRAMQALGWSWERVHARGVSEVGRLLAESTRQGPALAGPLDLGLLRDNPRHESLAGGDHYVAVLGVEGDRVRFHDPQGYPHALLPLAEFAEAWRADRVTYPHEPYTLRRGFVPGPVRNRSQMIASVWPFVGANLRETPPDPSVAAGEAALRRFASKVREGLDPGSMAFHTYFSFPLGTRRASDAAEFMREGGHPAPAALFRERARQLGGLQRAAVGGQWKEVATSLEHVADLEGKIVAHLPSPE